MPQPATTAPLFAALAFFLLGQALPAAAPPVNPCLLCGGKHVRVERFGPAGAGKHPAVVLLHGLDGMEGGGALYRAVAARLAAKGYFTVLVHYFDRTGTKKDTGPPHVWWTLS